MSLNICNTNKYLNFIILQEWSHQAIDFFLENETQIKPWMV